MGVSKTQVVKYIRKGDTGAKGEQGAVLRGPQAWSDCAIGYAFNAGGASEAWKDVVLYNGNYYSCIKSHAKTTSNYPGSTTDTNSKLWQLGDKIELVATKILLATYALVENLGVGAIEMKDANGNVIFQAKDGNVTCQTGTFDNIFVRSGRIAGFTVNGNTLYNTEDNDASVIFEHRARKAFAAIGGNVVPASSGIRVIARFENHEDTGLLGVNHGMMLSARGAGDNIALRMDGGSVSGMAFKNTIINVNETSKTLGIYDYNVITLNTSECIITLPSMQLYDDGHVIRIKRLGSGVKIKMAQCCTWNNNGGSRFSIPVLIYNQNSRLTGADTLAIDNVCDAMELVWCRDFGCTISNVDYYGAWVQYKLPRNW